VLVVLPIHLFSGPTTGIVADVEKKLIEVDATLVNGIVDWNGTVYGSRQSCFDD